MVNLINHNIMNMDGIKSLLFLFIVLSQSLMAQSRVIKDPDKELKPRVIVTSDGEIDDECSMVRFLLYANEWDIEGIVTSSSQYHWHGHNWAGDDWIDKYLEAYAVIYPNLVQHNEDFPTPDYLKSKTFLGNVESEGEMESITAGSQHIVKVLLDTTDNQPIWLQAWGGPNTIARALKTIEEEHPDKMEYVANKIRFYFIWEQDSTYQAYIRPNWGKYNILTIISDQFLAIAYEWNKILPEDKQAYFRGEWMKSNILEGHGTLCSLYKSHIVDNQDQSDVRRFSDGDFRSEGDSPAFLHTIRTGLRNMESPDYGGWGGRYVYVRENTWLDPVPVEGYEYPDGRWYTQSAWGRTYMREEYPLNQDQMQEYFKPMARWTDAIQNDWAARADWCILPYEEANHPPVVKLDHPANLIAEPGTTVELSAKGSSDPDGNDLTYHWWFYRESSGYKGAIDIESADNPVTSFKVPEDINSETKIHIICEVTDNGDPKLTGYQRIIIQVK